MGPVTDVVAAEAQARIDEKHEAHKAEMARIRARQATPLKSVMNFQASQDPEVTCFAKLSGPNGRFTDFTIDRDLAYLMISELTYHLKRQEKVIADAPRDPRA